MALGGQHSGRSSCGWVTLATAGSIAVVILLLLNTQHTPGFVTNAIPSLNHDSCRPCPERACPESTIAAANASWTYDPVKHAEDYGLSLDQCDAAFPGLFTEIEQQIKAKKGAPITEKDMSRAEWPEGTIKAMIWEGQVRH